MGKASRWMINLLLGKKDEKRKHKKSISFSDKTPTTQSGSIPSSPYRRWSFGKSSSKETSHKFSNSLDSITPLITQHAAAALDWGIQPKNNTKIIAIPQSKFSISLKDAAATRIQAAFRSYLAKKALWALRGLVKIQALVRGHLVRKQTTATMRQMHALMSIQVRARFHRIQMAEETAKLSVRTQSSRLATGLNAAYREDFDWDIYETDKRPRKYYSGELAVSKRDHQQYEFSFSTAHNSPQNRSPTSTAIPGRASFSYQKPDYVHPAPSPNYMSNTESSRAKVRSQSEPKQRPVSSIRLKRKTASIDGVNADKHSISTRTISPVMQDDEDPWFIKLYDATKPKSSDYDAKSTAGSSHSNYNKVLVTYEPHLHLY